MNEERNEIGRKTRCTPEKDRSLYYKGFVVVLGVIIGIIIIRKIC